MKPKNILVFYKDSDLAEHRKVLSEIERMLLERKLKARFVKRESSDEKLEKGFDLILSVGGDGTLLRAASFFKRTAILGINSNIDKSEGALCSATSADVNEKLEELFEGRAPVKSFTRGRVSLKNRGESFDAVNEIYIGSGSSYLTSRYFLMFGGTGELQKSSGIVIATGLGSTAWYGSITGERFDADLEQLRFAVREPYRGRLSACGLTRGKIAGEDLLSIKPEMKDAIAAIDSIKKIPLDKGEQVQVKVSPEPAKFIVFE